LFNSSQLTALSYPTSSSRFLSSPLVCTYISTSTFSSFLTSSVLLTFLILFPLSQIFFPIPFYHPLSFLAFFPIYLLTFNPIHPIPPQIPSLSHPTSSPFTLSIQFLLITLSSPSYILTFHPIHPIPPSSPSLSHPASSPFTLSIHSLLYYPFFPTQPSHFFLLSHPFPTISHVSSFLTLSFLLYIITFSSYLIRFLLSHTFLPFSPFPTLLPHPFPTTSIFSIFLLFFFLSFYHILVLISYPLALIL
jgi:hypothetical protein